MKLTIFEPVIGIYNVNSAAFAYYLFHQISNDEYAYSLLFSEHHHLPECSRDIGPQINKPIGKECCIQKP